MMRLHDRALITVRIIAHELLYRSESHHLTTDPACEQHRLVRPGSRLDRRSRGISCGPCMMHRAFASPADIFDVRQCRVCGCTDDDCSQCIEATGHPCSWVEWDLCSRCEAKR